MHIYAINLTIVRFYLIFIFSLRKKGRPNEFFGSSGREMIIIVPQFIRTNWFLCGILAVICFASFIPSIGARGGYYFTTAKPVSTVNS